MELPSEQVLDLDSGSIFLSSISGTENEQQSQTQVLTKNKHIMNTIAVYHNKGGVGKTTVAVNPAAALRKKGKRVLLIDIDFRQIQLCYRFN